jgi:uncharacterized repeat protein (TIGR01451 family)
MNMKKILTNTLISVIVFTNTGLFPVITYANSQIEEIQSEEVVVESKIHSKHNEADTYCKEGFLSPSEAATAYSSGLISFTLATNTSNTFATFTLVNNTKCKLPVSLSSYKMFDQTLSTQEFFHGTGLVYVREEGTLEVKLPSCMAQIDAWYGLYPETLLDSNPYAYPNVPFVITHKFLYNNGSGYADASGVFCEKNVNTPPVITRIGDEVITITQGNSYSDLGATALDIEDGNITSNIVTTGSVDVNTIGTYIIKYNVKDSKGLSAVEVTRTVKVIAKPIELKTAVISATKIVCKEESDLPNWGNGGPDISSTTASSYVASHPNCKIVPWTFEYNDASNPGDHVGAAGLGWIPFQSTTSVEVTTVKVWVREQFNSDYINFTGVNTNQNVSAELYCDTDVFNYDNYEWVVPSVPGKTYYCVAWNVLKATTTPVNTPPVITLVGANPITINAGELFVDPGATAQDLEDGNITANIVASSTVNTNVPGTYTITYNVVDSGGLHAVEVSRTVNVLEIIPQNRGKITFCLLLANTDNVIATSSYNLPQGVFTMSLSSTSPVGTSTIQNKVWNSESFTPNRGIILGSDAECITYDNLPYGKYLYSTLGINGSSWNTALYNDQATQPVNNIFDLYSYGTSTTNSDGIINIAPERYERTLVIVSKYNQNNQCDLPVIDSSLTSSILVNSQFTYVLTASSTSPVNLSVGTTTLPSWLTYATTTNTLSGVPTQTGTYNVDLIANNTCGNDSKTLVITVTGGGGGGGSPTSDISVVKTSDKTTANVGDVITYTISVANAGPNDATQVRVTDVLPSNLTFVSSTSTLGSYATSTGVWTIGDLLNNASTTLTLVANINSGTEGQTILNQATSTAAQTDPNNSNNVSTVTTSINQAPVIGCTSNCGGGGGGGGNGPISTFVPSNPSTPIVPNSCNYLIDYLRADFNNNPVEVRKLQVFLRDLEGHSNLQVTGIYDAQTITALDSFQNKYKADILTPWGHTAPTSYVYILTKKKVNEIYCKTAFPVNAQQQAEIDAYRNFLQGLRDAGVEFNVDTPVQNPSNWVIKGQVGTISTSTKNATSGNTPKENLATLAGYSSTTNELVSNLTANVIASGKKFANTLLGLFSFPFSSKVEKNAQCRLQCGNDSGLDWLNIILLIIIALLSYLWYREYRNNKKIDEINKVIDLE